MKLEYPDRKSDTAAWAKELGISKEAVDLYVQSDVIDLHIETFIWQRLFGYDMLKRHGRGPFGARIFGQIDVPRAREAHITGGTWSISTNPLRRASVRPDVFVKNLARIKSIFERIPEEARICRNVAEYRAARREGKHGAFFGIQGGNALDRDPAALDLITDDLIIRITVVHLTNSSLGATSAPSPKKTPLTDKGREFVRRMNEKKILVDLAHIDRSGFFDVVQVHDKSQPLIVTHTGIDAVHKHWRNLTDEQIRTVADTGGTIGIMYQWSFLGAARAERVVDHMEHVVKVAGDDYISLGSDWDGFIFPPRDMQTCVELPKLVQIMLDRGWSAERVQKALGKNFLRVLGHLRGDEGARA
jgi:membrane dipeptidase